MIKANFDAYDSYVTDSLYQWDLNQVLTVTGLNLTVAPEIHFHNANMERAIVRQASMVNHVVSVPIPNSLLQEPLTIKVDIGIYEGDVFKIIEKVSIPVKPKLRPSDYQIQDTDEEIYSFNQLLNALANKADSARVDNIIAHNNDTEGNTELVDIRLGANGTKYKTAGEAIRSQVRHSVSLTTSGVDLNQVIEPNEYIIGVTDAVNNPISSSALMSVVSWGTNRWITQFIRPVVPLDAKGIDESFYFRYGVNSDYRTLNTNFADGLNVSWSEWINLSNHRKKISTSGIDLNDIVATGSYVIGVSNSVNSPGFASGFNLTVENHDPYVIQYANDILNDNDIYYRTGRYATNTWSNWTKLTTDKDIADIRSEISELKAIADNLGASNVGYHIVNMGDSITDFDYDGVSLSSCLADITGAITYNCGFGGCRMSQHSSEKYNPYSMYKLADAIVSGDFSAQEEKSSTETQYATRVNTLKSIDFNNVDIVTIGYGTNDFTSGKPLDNDTDPYHVDSFGGALRYSIEKLLTAYPNLRIVIVAPTWRYWRENGAYSYDSDTHIVNDQVLHDFVDKCIEIGKEYHIPVVNPYDTMGINKFNYSQWFRESDGTHPSANGKRLLARTIAKTIKAM